MQKKRGQISIFIFLGLMLFIVVLAATHLQSIATFGRAADQSVAAGNAAPAKQEQRLQHFTNPGDVNHDGVVDIHDIYLVGKYFDEQCPILPQAIDATQDCRMGIDDAALVFSNYGKTYGTVQ